MPLGLRSVAALTPHADEYVAWAWAVNGFCSVVASVLATLLSMTFGFRVVMLLTLRPLRGRDRGASTHPAGRRVAPFLSAARRQTRRAPGTPASTTHEAIVDAGACGSSTDSTAR